jgi:hypothetical protein
MILHKYIYRVLIGVLAIIFFIVGVYIVMVTILQSQSVSFPALINSKSEYPALSFTKAHKISVNGSPKAIWNSYQFKAEDFEEGQNIISIERQSLFGVHGFTKDYSIFIDRVDPQLELISNIPQEVINQTSTDIYLQQEVGATLFYGDVKIEAKDKKINIPLKSGINNGRLKTIDRYQNISKTVDFSINNLTQTKYKTNKCDKFAYTLDTSQLQLGYSGVEGKPEITNESDIYFGEANLAKCDGSETRVPIFPLGFKASCWNCENKDSYITITNNQKIVNRPTPDNQLKYPNIAKSSEYISKSGIIGDLVKKINLSEKTTDGIVSSILQVTLNYDFTINEKLFQVSGSANINDPKYANFEQDFMFVIDHIYPTDLSIAQKNPHSELKLPGQFKVDDFVGLQFKYEPDWKVSYQVKKDNGFITGTKLKSQSNIVLLEKGAYSMTISQSLKDKQGTCSNPFELESKRNYSEKFIDGIKLLIPLVSKNKSKIGNNPTNKVLVVSENQYGVTVANCIFTSGVYDYSITINGYDIGKPVTSFDEMIEGEIINIISSISWF